MVLREINLISDDFLFRRKLSHHLSLWIFLLIISLSSSLGLYYYQTRVAHASRPSMESVEESGRQLSMKIEEIHRLQDELRNLDQRESGLGTAIGTPVYSRILLNLAEVMNDSTWINQLQIESDKGDKDGPDMNLKGFSKSGTELGDFIEHLSARPLFRDVSLIYARQGGPADSDQQADGLLGPIEFHIKCKVAG